MQDAIILSNYLYALKDKMPESLTSAFKGYFEEREPFARAAFETSDRFRKLFRMVSKMIEATIPLITKTNKQTYKQTLTIRIHTYHMYVHAPLPVSLLFILLFFFSSAAVIFCDPPGCCPSPAVGLAQGLRQDVRLPPTGHLPAPCPRPRICQSLPTKEHLKLYIVLLSLYYLVRQEPT